MAYQRFLVQQGLTTRPRGVLEERQARQVLSVLRLRPGDRIVVFDGTGAEAEAELSRVSRRDVEYVVGDVYHPLREPSLHLTVGLSLLRGDRFEVAAQKLTELGVRQIVPLAAERCVVSFPDARDWNNRALRYERIIGEALEQSERVNTVALAAPVGVEEFLTNRPVVTLVERGEHESIITVPLVDHMAIAIGPEGGWSERERELIDCCSTTVSLGRLILRSETAAIVSAGALIQRSIAS